MILDYAQQEILNTYDTRRELMVEYLQTLIGRHFSKEILKKFRQIEKDIPLDIPKEYNYTPEINVTSAGKQIQKYQDMFDILNHYLNKTKSVSANVVLAKLNRRYQKRVIF